MIRMHVTLSKFPRELRKLGDRLGATTLKGLRETAKFGRTAVVETSAGTSPRPVATRAYEGGWVAKNTRDGAILGNTTIQAVFVEVGRRRGKMPPVRMIEAWLVAKGVDRKAAKLRAFAVAMSIARRGFAGRHVLRRTMPALQNFFNDYMKKALRKAAATGPSSPKPRVSRARDNKGGGK